MFLIENKLTVELIQFFQENKIINKNEKILEIEKPGEGNMNLVLRIKTNERSFIVKQSREFVQKYPQILAPIERVEVEAYFYKTIEKNKILSDKMPRILAFYPAHYLLVLEDLGNNTDFTFLYQKNHNIADNEVIELTQYLSELHQIKPLGYPDNAELKTLNHFHIFDFPFDINNDFDLEQIQIGLSEIAKPIINDTELKKRIQFLGEIYLSKGNCLIHGDFYPGSWLKTNDGIKIIDPEFSYLGKPEFDLGVFMAHLLIAQKKESINTLLVKYQKSFNFDVKLMFGFAGVEIMRRLLGVAQLPIQLDLAQKKALLEEAKNLILGKK